MPMISVGRRQNLVERLIVSDHISASNWGMCQTLMIRRPIANRLETSPARRDWPMSYLFSPVVGEWRSVEPELNHSESS